jgi:hypothetical protein
MTPHTASRSFARALIRHVLLIVLVAVPIALAMYSVIWHLSDPATSDGIVGNFLDMTIIYPGVALVSAFGALPFTWALAVVSRRRGHASRRTALLALPLVLLPWLALPMRVAFWWPPFAVSALVGLLVLGLFAEVDR